jgi:hypothetical protein
MNKEYESYFQSLKRHLDSIQTWAGTSLTELERAVELTAAYRWALPLPGVTVSQIEYFKTCLPPFEAERRYHELLYQAEKTGARRSLAAWKAFWQSEANRLGRQIDQFPAVYEYHLYPTSEQDKALFGGDPAMAAIHANEWGYFMALERYNQYLETLYALYFNTHQS